MKVLLADEFDERADTLIAHLHAVGVEHAVRVEAGESLVNAVKKHAPDVIIVDMARADRDGLEPIREVTTHGPMPIIMFTDTEDRAFMEEAIAAGVSSYNVRGASLPDVKPIVYAAVAIFNRYHKVAEELRAAESRLDDHAMVQRAKSQLMQTRNIGEPQAYKWLRNAAMNRGLRIVDVAREVLEAAQDQSG